MVIVTENNNLKYTLLEPIVNDKGDMWIDTDDNNKLYVYSGTAWVLGQDYYTALSTAQNATSLANAAQSTANTASTNATNALNQLTDIASDNILSPVEKSTVIEDYNVITSEQSGIDSQATNYGVTTEKTAYDTAISALTTYLGTLTSPVAWNVTTGNTTIVGTTFRSKFSDVYTTRQTLLNKIASIAKTLADNAQSTANTAYTWSANASKLITNPDGGITGWSFGDGTNTKSYFKVYANNFSVSDGTTGYTPFSISGGNINFNGIVAFSNVTNLQSTVNTINANVSTAQSTANSANTLAATKATITDVQALGYVLPADVASAVNNNTTTINGSKITTGTITASQISSAGLSAGVITSGVIYNTGGSSSNYTMMINLDSGEIHIK